MNNILDESRRLAAFLKKSLGNLYEVIVLEYTDGELSIMKGNDFDEGYAKACFPLILQAIQDNKDSIMNQVLEIGTGNLNKISVQVIYDEIGVVIGAICILLHCGPFLRLGGLADEFLNFEVPNEENGKHYPSTLEGIELYIHDFTFEPTKTTTDEKTEMILDLYDMGMFNIKGAVAKVAEQLHISTKSVYRYIAKIKELRERIQL